jgi:hypothetical protein
MPPVTPPCCSVMPQRDARPLIPPHAARGCCTAVRPAPHPLRLGGGCFSIFVAVERGHDQADRHATAACCVRCVMRNRMRA